MSIESKAFATLQAQFALLGHSLYRTASPDGSVLYLAGKWGLVREMKTLDEVVRFFAMLGGRL